MVQIHGETAISTSVSGWAIKSTGKAHVSVIQSCASHQLCIYQIHDDACSSELSLWLQYPGQTLLNT